WFDQGAKEHDERLLRRVVAEALCSRYGDRALDLLGDWAFERGELGAAERWWRMIILPADQNRQAGPAPNDFCFPDPKVDSARVRAKEMLARLFAGENIDTALQAYRAQHANAQGRLAGNQGNYGDILQAVLRNSATKHTEESLTWPTFGGDAGHGRTATDAKARLMRI